ncbi:hypothetical protein ADUPG1_001979, partial [Aduncisulcus paluster]
GNERLPVQAGQTGRRIREMYVIPKGVEHKPVAAKECKVMLIEPRGVVNTGEAEGGELTAKNDLNIILAPFLE